MPRIRVPFNDVRYVVLDEDDLHGLHAGSYATVTFRKADAFGRERLVPRQWYSCREYFQGNSGRIKRLLFVHKKGAGKAVATFLHRVERMLKLGKTEFGFSACGPTQHNKLMWIEPSSWWIKKPMRRSFLTAMLRAGQNYNIARNNFESTLWTNRYLRQSKYAVRRFLKGYTEYTGDLVGWNNQFFWGGGWYRPEPPTRREVDELLVKP